MGLFGKLFGKKQAAANASPATNGMDKKGKANQNRGGKPKHMAKSVQEVLDFESITLDGIIVSRGDCYSKLYHLVDANFVTETEERQRDIILEYAKLVNRFPENTDLSIIIVNKRNTSEQLAKRYHIKPCGDALDEWRADYNNVIIDSKIADGRNDISKEKYIMLTVRGGSLSDAKLEFSSSEVSLQEAVKGINGVGVKPLDALERLKVMREILCGSDGIPFDEEFGRYILRQSDGEGNVSVSLDDKKLKKDGVSVKDLIAPPMITKTKAMLSLDEDRYAKSVGFTNLPQQLDTSFLTNATNIPCEMVTVIQLKAVPRNKARSHVRFYNTAITADVIKASQTAYKNGYDPSLMNADLAMAREEAAELRKDIVTDGKKLFYATLVVTLFGKDEKEIKFIESQYKAKCADFSITPNSLLGQQVAGLNTATLVGNSKIIIDRMLTGDNCCALFPFNIQELNDKRGHFYGINAQSKVMAMYDRKRSQLANGLIVGQSGSGKSFITKGEIIPNLLDSDDDIIILDPEDEYRLIAEAFGGTIIDLEPNSDFHINPCDLSMEWDDPKAAPMVAKIDYMVGLVESILGDGRRCTAYETSTISKACDMMYEPYLAEMKRRHDDGDNTNIYPELCPTLADFHEALLNMKTAEGTKIAMAIEPYCTGSFDLFAHHTNVESENRLIVFNLLALPDKMTEMAMKVCLAHIWTRVVRNKELNKKHGRDKSIWVYLDEFHLFFKSDSSAAAIMAYFKRVRKYAGIMTGITQDVADLLDTKYGTAMFNNTGFFIILKQSPIGREWIQRLWKVSDALLDYTKDKGSGIGILYNNKVMIPLNYHLPNESKLYKLMSTNPHDKKARQKTLAEVTGAEMQTTEIVEK